MKKSYVFIYWLFLILFFGGCRTEEKNFAIESPSGNIRIELDTVGTLSYQVWLGDLQVIKPSKLGISLYAEEFDFTGKLDFLESGLSVIEETYQMPVGKRKICENRANEKYFMFKNASGQKVKLIFRAYDDGIAYRYQLFNSQMDSVRQEISEINLDPQSLSWVQDFNWGFENYFPERRLDTLAVAGYLIPALIKTPDQIWLLISDAAVFGNYAACQFRYEGKGHIRYGLPEQVFDRVVRPNTWDEVAAGEKNTVFAEPDLITPWRAAIMGDQPGDIVESVLIQNLNPPCALSETNWIKPGVATFPWWGESLANDDPAIMRQYIDMAAEMNWEYVEFDIGLIGKNGTYSTEAWWDVAYIPEVIEYAKSKGLKVYGWDERRMLDTPEKRDRVFSKYVEWGVSGIKIDFLNSDKQVAMQFREDVIRHAAKYHLLVSFHGEISPRGMQRTYPHIMTLEGVKGAEYWKFPTYGTVNPIHNTTLPFTRNVVGSMDYTPVTFTEANRKSTYAHEMALPFVYESGWTCMADRPDAFLQSPAKELFQKLETAWDDIVFIDGYPGDFCCLARKKNDAWFVAAINANKKKDIRIDFSFLDEGVYEALLYQDDRHNSVVKETMQVSRADQLSIPLYEQSGFVMYLWKKRIH